MMERRYSATGCSDGDGSKGGALQQRSVRVCVCAGTTQKGGALQQRSVRVCVCVCV